MCDTFLVKCFNKLLTIIIIRFDKLIEDVSKLIHTF